MFLPYYFLNKNCVLFVIKICFFYFYFLFYYLYNLHISKPFLMFVFSVVIRIRKKMFLITIVRYFLLVFHDGSKRRVYSIIRSQFGSLSVCIYMYIYIFTFTSNYRSFFFHFVVLSLD